MAILRHSVCVRFVDSSLRGTSHAVWNVAERSSQPRGSKGATKVVPRPQSLLGLDGWMK